MALYTIAPGVPFADALAAGLLDRCGGDPLRLTAATILLPTRRACATVAEAFLRVGDGRAMLLPRLMPLGDLDEDDMTLSGAMTEALDLPPAMPPLHRQLLLARLLKAGGQSAEQALLLAGELARLIDQVATERLDWRDLDRLSPEEYADHWRIVLDVLAVVRDVWPGVLAERGLIDPAERRNLVMAAQAELWRRAPPDGPVVAAGSTGSIPATADLLRVVAELPGGMVVLPGLDRDLEPAAWAEVAKSPSHPQHGMALLLRHFGATRADVVDWPSPLPPSSMAARNRLLSVALAPAELLNEAIDGARGGPGNGAGNGVGDTLDPVEAMAGVTRIDAVNPHQEAAVIALILRDTLERPDETAALVTPDRDLARRVGAELARFGIAIDDSAGRPLDRTRVGMFLRLIVECVATDWAPIPLLAMLKHPLAACGAKPAVARALARDLERAVLRGPRPAPGPDGLRAALGAVDGAARLAAWTDALEVALAPLTAAMARRDAPIAAMVAGHVAAAEALAATDAAPGDAILWSGEDGEAAAALLADLLATGGAHPADMLALDGPDYPAVYGALAASVAVRPRYGRHPRLRILGPLEARLQQADRLILAGLNEGTWPAEPGVDPWLSRPMRQQFGLPALERRIGQSAHDFAQGFAAREVFLTRAQRIDGAPTVRSRWLQRLDTVLAALNPDWVEPASSWLGWQALLDAPPRPDPIVRPEPRPPVAVRPTRLSVTAVEMWMRDPYALYAKRILNLEKLDPIDAEAGVAERGTFIHAALNAFVEAYPGALPADAEAELLRFGRDAFAAALDRPSVWAFWWPRFERVARWFVVQERERRPGLALIATERKGERVFEDGALRFTLTAKADRIERRLDGSLEIIDYKTGTVPSSAMVAAGLSPQLPLEALIAMQPGGFGDLGGATNGVAALSYWRLSGGDPAGVVSSAISSKLDLDAVIRTTEQGLRRLIRDYADPNQGYAADPRPANKGLAYNDYAHLARLAEWSVAEADDES